MAISKSVPDSRTWRFQRWFGFQDKSNFRYYLLLSSVSFAFIAWMFRSMFIKSIYCNPYSNSVIAPAGECYWYLQPGSRYYWGIQLHLSTCFPALALAILQFTPKIRQKYPRFHRYTGRVTMVLGIVSSVAALLIADVAMGGTSSTFSSVLTLALMSLVGHYKGWTAARSGDIHIHRRWMLRTWGWLGCIITTRPLIFGGALLITGLKSRFPVSIEMSCEKLLDMAVLGDRGKTPTLPVNIFHDYASECVRSDLPSASLASLRDTMQAVLVNQTRVIPQQALESLQPGGRVLVQASLASRRVDQAIAAINLAFGPGIWLALIIHTILIEVYLNATKEEHERLRRVSDMRRKREKKTEAVDGQLPALIEVKKSL